MSNQEGQFMSPDSRNIHNDWGEAGEYVPRPVNTDPREQQQQQAYGEKLQPQQRKRRGPRGCIIALVIVLVILGLAGTGIGLGIANFSSQFPHFGPGATQSQSFTVGASPHLVINDPVGTINVRTGLTGSQVTIQATKHSAGIGANLNNIHVNSTKSADGNTITVNVNESPAFLGFDSVDLNITVPQATALNVHSNVGSIDVSGVNGQMSLMSNTGSITATQDELTASSTLKTDTGSVTFDGQIAATGSYQFESNTGSVDVTLPSNTSFHVNASTNTGSINSNFPRVMVERQGIGGSVNSDVGNSPNATLLLKTDTGSIDLNQRQ